MVTEFEVTSYIVKLNSKWNYGPLISKLHSLPELRCELVLILRSTHSLFIPRKRLYRRCPLLPHFFSWTPMPRGMNTIRHMCWGAWRKGRKNCVNPHQMLRTCCSKITFSFSQFHQHFLFTFPEMLLFLPPVNCSRYTPHTWFVYSRFGSSYCSYISYILQT